MTFNHAQIFSELFMIFVHKIKKANKILKKVGNMVHPNIQLKGVGGGVRVEIFFFGDSDSKFSVLSPAFYGISKFRPEGPQFCGFVWVGGGP